MERIATTLLIGDWCVNPVTCQISRNGESARVEERTMRLLLCLAEHAGQVVSIDELLNQVWPDVIVTSDSVYQAVTSLRRLLGDDTKNPIYIATVPRLGYRLLATVSPLSDPIPGQAPDQAPDQAADASSSPTATLTAAQNDTSEPSTTNPPAFGRRLRAGFTGTVFKGPGFLRPLVVAICLAAVAAFVIYQKSVESASPNSSARNPQAAVIQQPERSIAVVPFLDLTEGMKQEEFADGMTEELIDRLSKIPGVRVPGATSSFYFKGKQMPVADIARSLGVAYILDGSVRKSGTRLRVAARLIRADSGYVVWSETYDRPFTDILMVQDDIAGEVTKALTPSIVAKPDH